MNKKDKWSIPILLMFVGLIVLLIVFSDAFVTNTENAANEQLAVVTFFPNNSTFWKQYYTEYNNLLPTQPA